MKNKVLALQTLFYYLSHLCVFFLYVKGNTTFKVVVTSVALVFYTIVFFITNKQINIKKNVKCWILICLWILFLLKCLFDASLLLFLVVDIGIQFLYWWIDDYLNEEQSKENQSDGSVIDPD